MKMSAEEKAAAFDKVCDLFAIGSNARSESTLLVNVENCIDIANKLHAIESQYFTVKDDEIGEYSMINSWGNDLESFVIEFGKAIKKVKGE